MPLSIGIESLSLYTPRFSLPLHSLAEARGIDPNKYIIGLGQEEMSVMPPDEDIVSMAANAASKIITPEVKDSIKLIMFATESGVDQSKAAGLWVHHLLDLPKKCRIIELKQACYSATCALTLARSYLSLHPDERVLVIASDNARYGLNTPGEPTQGCAAAAFLVSHTPRLLEIEPEQGYHSEHIMDFWRPNYLSEAIVDGKYSTRAYLSTLASSWDDYAMKSKRGFHDHSRFCYHVPFSKMAEKAHERLVKINSEQNPSDTLDISKSPSHSLTYSKKIGNGYTASLYISLASLLENDPHDLSLQRLGLFSYGSGCVGEFFSGIVPKEYTLLKDKNRLAHEDLISSRKALSCSEYEQLFSHSTPTNGSEYMTPVLTEQGFRFKGVKNHERLYEHV